MSETDKTGHEHQPFDFTNLVFISPRRFPAELAKANAACVPPPREPSLLNQLGPLNLSAKSHVGHA